MARKEIIFFTGKQILIVMAIIGNALVVGFFMRFHGYKQFLLEDADLTTFTIAQKKEHDVKEEIRVLEGAKTWNDTAYAKKNQWSIQTEDEEKKGILDLIK